MFKSRLKLMKAMMLVAGISTPMFANCAFAADEAPAIEPTPEWTFPINVGIVSDYIFRGQSQTWGKPAIQFGIEADHSSGLYAGFFISNVSGRWLPGATMENDYYGGFRGTLPGAASAVAFDVGAIYYVYPGANWKDSAFAGTPSNTLNTVEIYGSLTYDWLTFKSGITTTEYFGWDTHNSPVNGGFHGDLSAGVTGSTRGSYYYEFDAAKELIPTWTFSGQLGRQIINNATGLDITYYKVGVSKAFDGGWAVAGFFSGSNTPAAYQNFQSLGDTTTESDVAQNKVFASVSKSF